MPRAGLRTRVRMPWRRGGASSPRRAGEPRERARLTFPAPFAGQEDRVVRTERHAFALRLLQGGEIDAVGFTPLTCEQVGSPIKRQSGLGAKDRPLAIGRNGSIGEAGFRVCLANA